MWRILCCQDRNKKEDSKNKLDQFEQAILKAKQARDDVKKYIKKMESSEERQKQLAKEALKQGKREKAKLFLGRSKAFQTQIDVGRGQLNMIEEQILRLDQSKLEKDALKVMEEGNSLLKQLQEGISIDKWEKVREDMDDLREGHREISEFLQKQGLSEREYDEEISNELERLERTVSDAQFEFPDVKNKEKKDIIINEESEKKKEKMLL